MIFLIIPAGIFALEYMLKEHVNTTRIQGTKKEILSGRIILRNCHNDGLVFGMFRELQQEYGRELTALALGGVIWEYLRQMIKGGSRLAKLGLSLMLGGGVSNFYERCRKGYVTDYFSLGVKQKKLQKLTFNLSDVAIMMGTLLWALSAAESKRKEKK